MKFQTVFLLLSVNVALVLCSDWQSLSNVLSSGVAEGHFPGCAALVASRRGLHFIGTAGNFTYDTTSHAVQTESLFDLASLTKVTTATMATAQFYQRGELDLYAPVSRYLPGFEQNGKDKVKIINLMLHNAGLSPDPSPNYNSASFDCPETSKPSPQLSFSCRPKIYKSLLAEKLQNPVGTVFSYSDISMMAMMNVLGSLAKTTGKVKPSDLRSDCPQDTDGWQQCYFEAYVRMYIFNPLGMSSTTYRPDPSKWANIVPTEIDNNYRHRLMQGEVHDENCFAMGGISGHAGAFSTVLDYYKYMSAWMWPTKDSPILNSTTALYFTKEFNHTQSSRAIGWDTNDYTMDDQGYSQSCGSLSENTFMHTGFTGTLTCGDRDRELIVILFSNRVYPARGNSANSVYKAFSTLAQKLFDSSN
eukprot:TRINITY_DN6246_c0_g1_i1.p1 TRINITY_DN6246_c0_g1~~TRINITY_DN6246_c0_g1_i1.p1  ORF type:complete len:417 (-),score=51.62 TRINITY_DN6246_c0_g1_i1:18-1268(-)